MPSINIVRQSDIVKTPRVMQLEGIFDVPPSEKSAESWQVSFELPENWNIGLIVGASGSGKTTVARELFGENIVNGFEWSKEKSILDDFPREMSIKEICGLLSSVGFSSPPSWMRPFHVLSNGEQFRVNMARTLAENKELAVVDEFTSVVDRTVAKIGSAAIQKTVRTRGQKFIAVSCHYDIAEWLEPDWIYQPATNEFAGGRSLRRPEINLEVRRVHSDAWQLFRKHHYLNTSLNTSAVCFCAFLDGVPVAFTGVLHFPHPTRKNTKREHRTVCLPDYQGVGIGNAMSAYIGSVCKGLDYSYLSQTSHPAMMRYRAKSYNWKMIAKPNRDTKAMASGGFIAERRSGASEVSNRIRATFEYIGAALPREEAAKVWNL
jgi:ABC-type phosphate/phosphonate transport system ATPase subunit